MSKHNSRKCRVTQLDMMLGQINKRRRYCADVNVRFGGKLEPCQNF